MFKKLVFVLSYLLLASCQSDSREKVSKSSKRELDSLVISTNQDYENNCNNDYKKFKKVRSNKLYYPNITEFQEGRKKFNLEMLIPNFYHEGEIDPKIKNFNWIGLFQNKEGLYLKKAKLNIDMSAPDELFDTIEGQNSGIEVAIKGNKDVCFLLFQGDEELKEGKIVHIPFGSFARKTNNLPPNYIAPGKPYSFNFNNTKYTLFAAAGKFEDYEDYFEAKHYQLYLGIGDKPHEHNQLLSFDPNLSGDFNPILSIDFIGDLDGDDKPDLILDCANSMKYLFLSRNAEKGKLLRLGSAFSYWFGC